MSIEKNLNEIRKEITEIKESTYDLSEFEEFFIFFKNKWNKKINFPLYNVTKFFKNHIKNKKVFIFLSFLSLKEIQGASAGVTSKNNTATIVVRKKEIQDDYADNPFIKSEEVAIIALKHELIHILDYIKTIKEDGSKKPEFVFVSSKRNLLSAKVNDETQKLLRYMNNDYEFNRIINEIKEDQRNNTNLWKKLKESKNINEIIEIFVKKIVIFNPLNIELMKDLEKVKKIIMKDDNIKKRIIKRLIREGLAPGYKSEYKKWQ